MNVFITTELPGVLLSASLPFQKNRDTVPFILLMKFDFFALHCRYEKTWRKKTEIDAQWKWMDLSAVRNHCLMLHAWQTNCQIKDDCVYLKVDILRWFVLVHVSFDKQDNDVRLWKEDLNVWIRFQTQCDYKLIEKTTNWIKVYLYRFL